MDIRRTLEEYDALFAHAAPDEIHAFLKDRIREAKEAGDREALLTLLNEQIGLARDTDRREIVLAAGPGILELLQEMGLSGSAPAANSLLNVANAYRVLGNYADSEALFEEAEQNYRAALPERAPEFAGLYNNWSLLCIANGQKQEAARLIREAIYVCDRYDAMRIPQATSRANLALLLLELSNEADSADGRGKLLEEARTLLREADDRHRVDGGEDYHYSGVLAAFGDLEMEEGAYPKAVEHYRRAMEIIRRYLGENHNYQKLAEKLRRALIADIIHEEWRQFDRVQNEGGRAGCQDDWNTFFLMRSAQFWPWPDDLLQSYLQDLQASKRTGRNLLTEKYAWMMASTAPEAFAKLRPHLPVLSEERISREERVIAMHVQWNEELCARYPAYALRGRYVHTADDTLYDTSSETYLRGELHTYSDETFARFEEWTYALSKEGVNPVEITAELIARGYGYATLADAEEKLRSRGTVTS